MKCLQVSEIDGWVRSVLLDPRRSRPVVAVTTSASTGRFWIEPEELSKSLAEWADVVAFETGDATWELADALPDRLDVYGGAMRVWWPGLTLDSDPYEHKLYLVHSEEHARREAGSLERELRRRASRGAERFHSKSVAEPDVPEATRAELEEVTVRVRCTAEEILVEDAGGSRGRLVAEGQDLDAIAVCLKTGMELTVSRPLDWDPSRGLAPCSIRDELPSPWAVVGAELEMGDLVQGRVVRIDETYALVELVPGARGIVGLAEVDSTFVEDIDDFLEVNELVKVRIQALDPEGRKAELSVKDAQRTSEPPRPLPSLVPGGRPFEWTAYLERLGLPHEDPRDPRDERIEELERELAQANGDRANLRRRVADLTRERKALEERLAALERADERNPLADERSFLRAVRVAYARAVDEGERHERPLLAMRVGPSFLESARALQGVDPAKIVEVASQVASERAREIDGREVHPLTESGAGSRQRVRQRDDAKAWRCALQRNTPAARRLHWWRVPGGHGGAAIEFASVAVHDEFGIPE